MSALSCLWILDKGGSDRQWQNVLDYNDAEWFTSVKWFIVEAPDVAVTAVTKLHPRPAEKALPERPG